MVRRTELVCIRDLSKGASRSTIIERGQYIAEANQMIIRLDEELTSCIIEALIRQCLRVSAYNQLNKAPYNAGSSGMKWGVKLQLSHRAHHNISEWRTFRRSHRRRHSRVSTCSSAKKIHRETCNTLKTEEEQQDNGKVIPSHTRATHQPQPTGGSEFVIRATPILRDNLGFGTLSLFSSSLPLPLRPYT